MPVQLRFDLDGQSHSVTLRHLDGHRYEVRSTDGTQEVELVEQMAHRVRFILGGVMESAHYLRDGERLLVAYGGLSLQVVDTTRAASQRADGSAGGDGKLRASMNGRVVAVLVKVGDRVEAGAPIITLEAMKMEHIHSAAVSGTVRAVHVSQGDQVPSGRIVAEIEMEAKV